LQIEVDSLKSQKIVAVSGREPWLEIIYDLFPVPEGESRPQPLLSGEITFKPEVTGLISANGKIEYQPYVDCSRCAAPIQWNISTTFSVSYRPELANQRPTEHTLEREELDEYEIEDGMIDVAQLLNDQVQLVLPSQTVLASPDGKNCRVCLDPLEGDLVVSIGEQNISPFSILKNLKDDDDGEKN